MPTNPFSKFHMYFEGFKQILSNPHDKSSSIKKILKIIIWKSYQRFIKRDVILTISVQSKLIVPVNSSYGSILIYTNQTSDYNETQLLKRILKQNDVFIDVGANIGYFTMLAASLIKTGKIIAFEPNTSLLSNIQQSLTISNIPKELYSLEASAVGATNGYANFIIEPESELSHLSATSNTRSVKVPIVTLDKYLSKHKINKVKLIKIDTEGFEPDVFKGLSKSLSNSLVDNILYEHGNYFAFNDKYYQLIDEYSKFGYVLFFKDFSTILKANDLRNISVRTNLLLSRTY